MRMNWLRYVAALAVLLVVTVLVGAVSRISNTVAQTSSLYTIGLLVVSVLVVIAIAVLSTDRVSTPYW